MPDVQQSLFAGVAIYGLRSRRRADGRLATAGTEASGLAQRRPRPSNADSVRSTSALGKLRLSLASVAWLTGWPVLSQQAVARARRLAPVRLRRGAVPGRHPDFAVLWLVGPEPLPGDNPISDKSAPSVVAALDRTFRAIGGAPTYVLTDNEKTVTDRHIAGVVAVKGYEHALRARRGLCQLGGHPLGAVGGDHVAHASAPKREPVDERLGQHHLCALEGGAVQGPPVGAGQVAVYACGGNHST